MWHTREMPKQMDYKLNEVGLSQIEESIKKSEKGRVIKRATALAVPVSATAITSS